MKKKGTLKTGGRTKGTPNKVTTDLRKWVNLLIENSRERLEKDFEALEPKERWMIVEKLMQYVIPKKREEESPEPKRQESEALRRMFGLCNE